MGVHIWSFLVSCRCTAQVCSLFAVDVHHRSDHRSAVDSLTFHCTDTGTMMANTLVRPTPQSLPLLTHNLLTEMAGQLGRLASLAHEMQGLREENQALVRTAGALRCQDVCLI